MPQTSAVKRLNLQTSVHGVYFCPGWLSRWSKCFGRNENSSNVCFSDVQQMQDIEVIKNKFGLI